MIEAQSMRRDIYAILFVAMLFDYLSGVAHDGSSPLDPHSVSSASTATPDPTFVPASLLARHQSIAPVRFEQVSCGSLANRQIDEFDAASKSTKRYL